MLPIKKPIAIVVFVSTMVTGWVAPELVLPATAPVNMNPLVVIAEPADPLPQVEPSQPTEPPPAPPGNGKICYLTFDDGPDGIITPAMLDVLKEHGVKATFFVVGNKVDQYPSALKRIKDEGHAIGNHTYYHDYHKNNDLAAFTSELERTNQAIKRVTGERTSLIRVPGGSTSTFRSQVMPGLAELGYEYFDWNVDSRDALDRKQNATQMADRVANGVAKHKVAIVLMHSINTPTSLKALPSIIERIQKMGYSFRVIGSSTKPIQFSGN